MNEAQTLRPSKKQRELLSFIEQFIGEHGYSPSYREIMSGCDYTSVATVSLHVNNLIARGHLRKRDRSARSLEVVQAQETQPLSTNQVAPSEEKWLVEKVDFFIRQAEQAGQNTEAAIQDVQVLVEALKVLGLEGAAQSYAERLRGLQDTVAANT
jgi:SOS-response transcriptional repressor LexA